MKRFNPASIAQPASNYSQGVLHSRCGRRLVIAGQVGAHPDGRIEKDMKAQVEIAFANFMAVLREAGMGPEHLVRITAYATKPDVLPHYREARDKAFEGHKPASTYFQVAALAHADFLFEVDGEAVIED